MRVKESCKLFEQFRHYGIEFLIPEHLTSDDDDEEGIAHSHNIDEEDYDLYVDDEYNEDEDHEEYEDADYEEYEDTDSSVTNLDDLLRLFDSDWMEYREFAEMNVWDLFNISKKQFDMIDWRWISGDDFSDFYSAFTGKYSGYSIEKRILYSTLEAITGFSRISGYSFMLGVKHEDMVKYLHRIVDTHEVSESRNLLNYLQDYYRFYRDALAMNERRVAAGEAPFKYEIFPKPAHIKDLHNKAFHDHQVMETERMKEKKAELDAGIHETVTSPLYIRYLYKADQYSVVGVKNQGELEVEGDTLRHCVASYGSNLADGSSYIYFIRKSAELDVPYFTVEVIPGERPQDKPVLKQCYTTDDSIDKPESLRKFIREWCKRKYIKIGCEI